MATSWNFEDLQIMLGLRERSPFKAYLSKYSPTETKNIWPDGRFTETARINMLHDVCDVLTTELSRPGLTAKGRRQLRNKSFTPSSTICTRICHPARPGDTDCSFPTTIEEYRAPADRGYVAGQTVEEGENREASEEQIKVAVYCLKDDQRSRFHVHDSAQRQKETTQTTLEFAEPDETSLQIGHVSVGTGVLLARLMADAVRVTDDLVSLPESSTRGGESTDTLC